MNRTGISLNQIRSENNKRKVFKQNIILLQEL